MAHAVLCRNEAGVKDMVAQVWTLGAASTLWVNNAGILRDKTSLEMEMSDFRKASTSS